MSIVNVDCENLASNPRCPHGPMVKLTKVVKGSTTQFYGCSACREPKDCPFSLKIGEEFSDSKLQAIADAQRRLEPKKSHSEFVEFLEYFKKTPTHKRFFCKSCFELFELKDSKSHHDHEVLSNITNETLKYPLRFLAAKTDDKKEAQYWFDDVTKEFSVSLVKELKSDAVLCLGTPSIFEKILNQGVKCMFLDIDPRYMTFYNEEEFGWFNMMNFHFLSDAKQRLESLRQLMKSGKVSVFIDPPFGVRLEILAATVEKLRDFGDDVTFFLALPYFMEPHVTKSLPDFKILDYVLHYENHSKMRSHKKSAVRYFTNVSLNAVSLPASEGYRFCDKCDCWRHPNNVHCDFCGTCPSKNGSPYRHCEPCNTCVKSTWEHCVNCGRCFLAPHKCHVNPLLKRRNQDKMEKKNKKFKSGRQ